MKSALVALALVFVAGCNAGGSIGWSCTSAGDCDHGQVCDLTQPGGFCTRGCGTAVASCPSGSVCGSLGTSLACVPTCTAPSDCRAGYACTTVGAGPTEACQPTQ